ncbi:type I polyketide synthase [Anabaena azotica]|uniref:Acyl carrier protein n=1 Tax=Anabaena azotica FACHB-119 TaxID=947527 RepID=A0ABR8DCS2_9NOST|nr:type I polyketide synthase [Anabaena azotica]MBD2504909.1 acyl carrier protein [Anabaena azotica FACHB-119]
MEAIAIIGIGVRFPGAQNPESFWHLLREGVDAITEVPPERWNVNEFYDPKPATPGKMITRCGGFLDDVGSFDAGFFGISPREAECIDPQQRLVLEVAWEALENAGIAPQTLNSSQTGVFVGIGNYDYGRLQSWHFSRLNAYDGTGTTLGVAANRLSYVLNLQGPSLVVETSCSSSLVAVHYACQSLRTQESNLCLVGGVSLMLSPESHIIFSQAKMMAPDGRCKTFDASADGYVRGEGCGVVVLKRLGDALRDGDNILATIRGSAVNQDGRSNGLTAPNGPAQQAVIRKALENAGVTADQISYVEAHGTGTALGDPIEVNSLKTVLMKGRQPNQTCYIGSVKTNIGHLEPAAGIAGLIKVVLALQNKQIPPHLHFQQLNPYIKINNTPLTIPTELQEWNVNQGSRLAGVSAFGFGGTNAHVILEEAPESVGVVKNIERPQHLLALSARSGKALQELVERYEEYIESHPERSLEDICYTANTGRSHFPHRLAIIADHKQELADKLSKIIAEQEVNQVFFSQNSGDSISPKIVFLFTGQGSQYINMGRQLYETQTVFRQTIDKCDRILQSYLDKSLLDILYPEDNQQLNKSLIDQTAYTQPALFAIEYALAQLWQSWGIKPDVVMGHSVGEYVAATIAEVFSLEDGLKLIAHRGRLMQSLPDGGEMLAVMATEEKVNQLIAPYKEKVAIAAINGPFSIVISGAGEVISTIRDSLNAQEIKTHQLQVSHAFHSPLMEPMLAEFEAIANTITYNQPQISLISNIFGTKAQENIATANYWVNHVRQPVHFAQSMEVLHQEGYEIFLEIGPKPILLGMGRECLIGNKKLWLPSLHPSRPDWLQMLQTLGQLYAQGVKVDWAGFYQDYSCQKVALPTYPWQRKRYWITNFQESQNQDKISSIFEGETTITNGHIQLQERQMNENEILQKPKLTLSNPELLSFPKSPSKAEETPIKQLSQTVPAIQSKPAESHQPQVESANIAQTPSRTTLNNGNGNLAQIKQTLKESLASALYTDISEIAENQKFIDLGLDSIVGVEWITTINKKYNLNLKATKLYDYPTLLDLAKYINQEISSEETPTKQLAQTVPAIQSEPAESHQPQVNIAQTPSRTTLNNGNGNLAQIKQTLKESLASALYTDISEIAENQKFIDLGLDSIVGVEWITTINKKYNLNLKATKLYDYPTLLDLAKYITQEISSVCDSRLPQDSQESAKASSQNNGSSGDAGEYTLSQDSQESAKASSQNNGSSGDAQADLRLQLRSILNKVANKELTVEQANQIIQELKQKAASSSKVQGDSTNNNRILQIIKKSVYEVEPKLEKYPLKTTDSLKQLGVDSVNRAEILTMVMEELDLHIPLIQLAGAQNIGELADLFATKLEAHHGI